MPSKYFCGLLMFLLISMACTSSKKSKAIADTSVLTAKIEQFIHCHNTRNLDCLLALYHKNYQSLSPISQPESLRHFIQKTLNNLENNNFELAVQIKDISSSESLAYVAMNWQLKTKGPKKENAPFANVQRLDIWKKNALDNWCIFRTVIYDERAFKNRKER